MLTIDSVKRYWLSSICLLALTLALAACGAASSNSNSSSGNNSATGASGSTATAPVGTPVKGFGTTSGCPSDIVANTQPTKAGIIITATQGNQTITAHNGDVIEIRFPFGHKWTGPMTSQGILQIQPPAGYALKGDNVCVWRFAAQGTGTAQLVFHSQPLCKPGEVCPQFITTIPFEFNIQ